jgi:hypothetical protein
MDGNYGTYGTYVTYGTYGTYGSHPGSQALPMWPLTVRNARRGNAEGAPPFGEAPSFCKSKPPRSAELLRQA